MKIKNFHIICSSAKLDRNYVKGIRTLSISFDREPEITYSDDLEWKYKRIHIKLYLWAWIVNLFIPICKPIKNQKATVPVGFA